MDKSKEKFLFSLINRKTRCKFTPACRLYSTASYTCTHTGGSYCGKYRKLKEQNEEPFGVQTNRHLIEIPQ
jgi:hypothetical protein